MGALVTQVCWWIVLALGLLGCRNEPAPHTSAVDAAVAGGADVNRALPACAAVRAVRLSSLPGGGAGLLVGPQAVAGQSPDDVVLDNAHVRFVVRGGPTGVAMYGTTGGHLVDAGRVLPGGDWRTAPVQTDDLREVAISVGMRVLRPSSVEVVADGCDGTARVRVRGDLVAFPTLQEVLDADDPKVIVEHEYVLRADSPAIEIRTSMLPKEKSAQVLVADVLFWGGEVALYLPGYGDADLPATSQTSTVGLTPRRLLGATTSDATAYAFAAKDKLLTIDAGALHAFLHGTLEIDAKGLTLVRHLAAGRDLAAAMAAARTAAGLDDATRRVAGKVQGTVAAVVVEALDSEGKPLTRCATDGQGRFDCPVPVSTAELRAGWIGDGGRGLGGAGQTDAATATLLPPAGKDAGGKATALDLSVAAPAPAKLAVSATQQGKPLAVRLTLWPKSGAKGPRRVYADVDGATVHLVPPGQYDLWLHHGPTYSMHHQTVTLMAGATTTVQAELAQVVSTPGWLAMDSHVHAEQSSDSTLPVEVRLAQAAAEGLDYLIATDHDHLTDYRAWLPQSPMLKTANSPGKPDCSAIAVGASGAVVQTAVGVEVSTIKAGHFNIWPATPVSWYQLAINALFDALGAGQKGRVVQCNHPRFASFSLFTAIDFDAATTTASTLRCGALELINGIDHKATPQVVADWLGLLDRGIRMTGVGTSDCHSDIDFVGNPRSWVKMGDSQAATAACAFAGSDVDSALLAGKVIASAGPFLEIAAVAGGKVAAIGELLPTQGLAGKAALTVHVRVAAPDWLPLGHLLVFSGTQQIADIDVSTTQVKSGARDYAVDLPIAASTADGVVVAMHVPGESAAPGLYRPAWAVTNPVFLDWDGDGLWWGQPLPAAKTQP